MVCIQEHRYHLSEIEIKYHDTGNGWKNSVNAIIGGVGMLLSLHTLKSLKTIKKIQPRMMVATFNSNPSTKIICNSPTNGSDETDLNTFYNELSSLVHSIPKYNILIIRGEMNAQIDRKCKQQIQLTEWGTPNGFLIRKWTNMPNTKFQKRKGKLWTYTYANNAKARINYILMNKQ